MKTYEVVRNIVKMMDDSQPEQKKILWDAFTRMFDLMVEEYEDKKYTEVIQKAANAARASEGKAIVSQAKAVSPSKAAPKGRKATIDHGKIVATYKAGWTIAKIADECGCTTASVRQHLKKEGLMK